MLNLDFSPEPRLQRRQLIIIAATAGLGAALLWFFESAQMARWALVLIMCIALAGVVAFTAVGRDIYLLLVVPMSFLGRAGSWLMVLAMYTFAVAVLGSILKVFGMNQLEKDFAVCKKKATMFHDAPISDEESFRRQS